MDISKRDTVMGLKRTRGTQFQRTWRSIAFLVLALWVHALVAGCSHAPLAAVTAAGFRGIPWGTPLTEVSNMEIVDQGYGLAQGMRKSDLLAFGRTPLEKITYESLKGLFYAATLHFSGEENFLKILKQIGDEQGEPKIAHTQANVFVWSQGDISLSVRYYRSEGRGEVTYTYLPVALKEQKGESD